MATADVEHVGVIYMSARFSLTVAPGNMSYAWRMRGHIFLGHRNQKCEDELW